MVHNCLRARHIACFTIVHLICAKVQTVDNLSRISILKMILTFMRCHLSSGILFLKSMCIIPTKCSTFVCTYLGGVILQLGCLETNTFSNGTFLKKTYHMCSSLIVRKLESLELSIILQLASSCWFHYIFICFLHALYRLNSLVQ